MRLKHLEINGFKSFAKKTTLEFEHSVVGIVGPNGSGKSNVVEAFRFVLGEQSMKSMRGKAGTDLIFKGSKTLSQGSRASVVIYLDNTDKIFKVANEQGELVNLNFDTVSIARIVHADGLNKYLLNGSEVRLKDINNLLASVHIGSSGHHIISQGEADRILNSSSRDRREMIEEALGLKIYQYKIKESERKLERTRENIKEVGLLRRENTPHLNFLKKQVEKFELAKGMRVELLGLYKEYFKKEDFYLKEESKILKEEKLKLQKELEHIEHNLSGVAEITQEKKENPLKEEISILENKIYEFRRLKNELERKLGRIEAMTEIEEKKNKEDKNTIILSQDELTAVVLDLNKEIDIALDKQELKEVKIILFNIKDILNKFSKHSSGKNSADFTVLHGLKDAQGKVILEMDKISSEEENLRAKIKEIENKIASDIESDLQKEREKFELKSQKQSLLSNLEINKVKEENISKYLESLNTEKHEAVAIVGHEVLYFADNTVPNIDRALQEELKKKIERIKIKLEDAGASLGSDVLKEYKDMEERDQFLARELEDLKTSIESLEKIIIDLKEKVEIEFKDGIKKINIEFEEFFRLMFGGGKAKLNLVLESKKKKGEDEDGEDIAFEQGIEIDVSLPHKKVKELHALSGGERSLTSIALLFAMSQVNPPPFLILDETDAALDEANSRKYGDMLEKLSKHSQLIVVTHNRETMSRAGVIYGVTIGADGASKLLSIKFEEAQAIAK